MSIGRQQNWLGQQRVDVSDLRSLESGVAADFDVLGGRLMAGKAPLVVRGFSVATTGTSGNPADQLAMAVAGGILMHYGASEAGTLFSADDSAPAEILSATNGKVTGTFTASSVNYIGIDLQRRADSATSDLKQFLDANTLKEVPKTVPTGRTLSYKIIISTQPFSVSSNICPIAKVTTDASNRVVSVADCRRMLFRLGSGGDSPNAKSSFGWTGTRSENSVIYNPSASITSDPFVGGDKAITSLKGWMDAVMSVLWEAKSGQYWYSPTTRDDVKILFGSNVIPATGDNFQWNGGTNTLTWQGLSVAFGNSTAYYNVISDGSGVLNADGQCLYVDIQRDASGATLVPAVASLTSLGTPTVPGSRFVIAWRQGGELHFRDRPYEVGRSYPTVATIAANGTVRLISSPTVGGAPLVPVINSTGQAVGTGLSRQSTAPSTLGAGAITIGGTPDDTSIYIGSIATSGGRLLINGDSTLSASSKVELLSGTTIEIGTGGAGTGVNIGRKTANRNTKIEGDVVSIDNSNGKTLEIGGDALKVQVSSPLSVTKDVTVDSTKDYLYSADVGGYSFASATDFLQVSGGAGVAPTAFDDSVNPAWLVGGSSVAIVGRAFVPEGATIRSVEILGNNNASGLNQVSITARVTVITYTDAQGLWPANYDNTTVVNASNGTNVGGFYVLPITPLTPTTVPGIILAPHGPIRGSHVVIRLSAATPSGGSYTIFGVRIGYTYAKVKPVT